MPRLSPTSVLRRLILPVALGATLFPAPAAEAKQAKTASIPVEFQVQNVNHSALDCPTDGETYTVRGSIVGPRRDLRSGRAETTTLYLHGLAFGQFLFDFKELPNFDYAERQATRGLTSVVIDRLGYGDSDKPAGVSSCLGGQADVAHQIAQQLKAGTFDVTSGRRAPRFRQVILAGHSIGGLIAELTAVSFPDAIDGLAVIAFSNNAATPLKMQTAQESLSICSAGGELSDGTSGAPGYAYFGQTPEAFASSVFFNPTPRALDATVARRTRNPCGDLATVMQGSQVNLANLGSIDVPVLLIIGAQDRLYSPPAVEDEASRFTGTRDVTFRIVHGVGHAISLDGDGRAFARRIAPWLESYDRKGR